MNEFHDITVKNPRGAGRKPCTQNKAAAQQIIKETAPAAAGYLRKVSTGEIKRANALRVDVCKYLINQAIGAPKQRNEISGEIKPLELIVRWDGNRNETGNTPKTPASTPG